MLVGSANTGIGSERVVMLSELGHERALGWGLRMAGARVIARAGGAKSAIKAQKREGLFKGASVGPDSTDAVRQEVLSLGANRGPTFYRIGGVAP